MGDFDLATEIAAAFLADSPTTFSQLLAAVSSGDVEAAGKLAHTLKGSSANMGGEKLSRITGRMQTAAREDNLELLTELLPSANTSFQSLTAALVGEFHQPQ
jgi:HPt (histidine-containing phosphotransfer) domain-containing protein